MELIIAGLAILVVYGWLAIRDQQTQIETLTEVCRSMNTRVDLTNDRVSNALDQVAYLEIQVQATLAHTGLLPGEPPSND